MTLTFTKMHGTGNDYIYLDAFTETLPGDLAQLAVEMSPRHTGVGADGVIVIGPSQTGHARMQIWNADGSRAEMCGNGL
ncbi:MAG: diaminopimelate epimerase, partial [Planctomycetaceae bacterium]|nr:diaminopimelate epimerase [Planctomycetaceae bacterium]